MSKNKIHTKHTFETAIIEYLNANDWYKGTADKQS
jgi:hypothetical protein